MGIVTDFTTALGGTFVDPFRAYKSRRKDGGGAASGASPFANGFAQRRCGPMFAEEISPEELFRQFFNGGGGFGGGGPFGGGPFGGFPISEL